jgi:hypothetical protein
MQNVTLERALELLDEDLVWDMWIVKSRTLEKVERADVDHEGGAYLNGTWYDADQAMRIQYKQRCRMTGVAYGAPDHTDTRRRAIPPQYEWRA